MTKKNVTLMGRKRTNELRSSGASADSKNHKVVEDLKHQAISMQQQQTTKHKQNEYINEIVEALVKKYQIWSEPLDSTRFRYSPNKRSQLLRNEIKCILNDHANKLYAEGYQEDSCKRQCMELLGIISEKLRQHDVPIGHLHLTPSRKR